MTIRKILFVLSLTFSQLVIGQSVPTQDQIEHAERFAQWNLDWFSELTTSDEPWMWALSLHNIPDSTRDGEFRIKEVKRVIDKLLAHPAPTAEGLYWAALYCRFASNPEHVCRTSELIKRLMEVDGTNLNSSAIYFQTELAAKTGMGKTTSEHWDWSYFDAWLERAVTLDRAEHYDFLHYSEIFNMLLAFAKTEGIYSYLSKAPLEWRAAYFIINDLVYPWHGSMSEVKSHCQMSEHLGREQATLACRQLAKILLENSKSTWARSEALAFLAETYSRSDPKFVRYLRESAAWNQSVGPVMRCMSRFHYFAHKEWTVSYDVSVFVSEYESKGEIVALQNLADSANWIFKDDALHEYKCIEIPEMSDEDLSRILGVHDPAWEWCRDGEYCDPPSRPRLMNQ